MTPAASALPSLRDGALADTCVRLQKGMEEAGRALAGDGVPIPPLEGKLFRPLLAWAMVPPSLREQVDHRFWAGALAVQMVHEASLLHDDIVDEAMTRRGRETDFAKGGVGPALVLGDHYLTGAYRAASGAQSPTFLSAFIYAVERTVAGEVAQGRAAGRMLSPTAYQKIVEGKSGELFGVAAGLGGALFGLDGHDERIALGRAIGALYQQVDDLLDYCPAADTGKTPLQDFRQRKWTWVLDLGGFTSFDVDERALLDRLFRGGEESPARRALVALQASRDQIVERAAPLSPGDDLVAQLLDRWVSAAVEGVVGQERAMPVNKRPVRHPSSEEAHVVSLARALGGPESWPAYFGRHAKTFRFAARWFPSGPAADISGVYAFCRFTDDLVDEPVDGAPPSVLEARLESWAALSRQAFEGRTTGIPLLDVVLGEAGRRGVSWRYPDALLAGVAMDLTRSRYADWTELEEYTFGVAGAVGGWITQLFGLDDDALLHQAHALGHGMQLTNIARDVGEDWERGRVYLPLSLLREHRMSPEDLGRMRAQPGPVSPSYRNVVEALLARADGYYAEAWPGIRALPTWYRRPVAVAASAYHGIHDRIRANGHDNLRRRASTPASSKLILAASGLWRARG